MCSAHGTRLLGDGWRNLITRQLQTPIDAFCMAAVDIAQGIIYLLTLQPCHPPLRSRWRVCPRFGIEEMTHDVWKPIGNQVWQEFVAHDQELLRWLEKQCQYHLPRCLRRSRTAASDFVLGASTARLNICSSRTHPDNLAPTLNQFIPRIFESGDAERSECRIGDDHVL